MERDYRAIERVLVITFVFNTLATAVKLGVGLWTGALSLVADGLDSLFDGLSNIVGVVAVRVSSQPADREHPWYHEVEHVTRSMKTVMPLRPPSLHRRWV